MCFSPSRFELRSSMTVRKISSSKTMNCWDKKAWIHVAFTKFKSLNLKWRFTRHVCLIRHCQIRQFWVSVTQCKLWCEFPLLSRQGWHRLWSSVFRYGIPSHISAVISNYLNYCWLSIISYQSCHFTEIKKRQCPLHNRWIFLHFWSFSANLRDGGTWKSQ